MKENLIFADLHIHSRFSRACSKDITVKNLVSWAKVKGLKLLGTGDFTHPEWLKELKENLKEDNIGDGIFYYTENGEKFPFMLTHEISLIYTQNDRGRRIHLLYLVPSFESVDKINSMLDKLGRRDYDGRPIFKLSCRDFVKKMKEIDERIEIIPAHIWTPWFGLFGSKGGFDSLKDAFLDQVEHIHAIETGISSDPEMNWKVKDLENISILSFSDAHSYWPYRLGREATIFYKNNGENLTYDLIINQIINNSFYGTIETDPNYGKYHYDGHRVCNFSSSPIETEKLNGICPKCHKPLVIGVENRVNELSKINEPVIVKDKKKFYKLLPLHEIISLYLKVSMNSKGVWKIYDNLIKNFENEFNILLYVKKEELMKVLNDEMLVDLIIKNRIGEIKVKPGYDGEYGVAMIDEIEKDKEKQKTLF